MTSTTTNTTTNHSLVGNALQLLAVGLGPYIAGMLRRAAGRGHYVPDDADTFGDVEGDVAIMLKVMSTGWNEVFRDYLGPIERSLVSELRETRNRWAHMESFDDDDLDRALDSIGRLLMGVGARNEGERVNRAKHRLRRRRYGSADYESSPMADEAEPAVAEKRHAPSVPQKNGSEHHEAPPATPQYATEPTSVHMPPTPGVDNGEHMDTLIERGVACRQQGDFHLAITSFGKAISINREHAIAWYHRALTWGHMGEYERAINDFNRVISLDREFADAYNGRGYALFCLGDDPKAIADFEQAMLIDPNDDLTRANLERAQQRWDERQMGRLGGG